MIQVTESAESSQGVGGGSAGTLSTPTGLDGKEGESGGEVVGGLSKFLSDQISRVTENDLAGAVLLILAAIIFGKLVDKVLRATLNIWVKRSETPLDDLAIEHLSGPIVQTTVL